MDGVTAWRNACESVADAGAAVGDGIAAERGDDLAAGIEHREGDRAFVNLAADGGIAGGHAGTERHGLAGRREDLAEARARNRRRGGVLDDGESAVGDVGARGEVRIAASGD